LDVSGETGDGSSVVSDRSEIEKVNLVNARVQDLIDGQGQATNANPQSRESSIQGIFNPGNLQTS
jgi:hypothetical protein